MPACPGPNGRPLAPPSRRAFLRSAGGGFGMIALAGLLAEDGLLANDGLLAGDGFLAGDGPLAGDGLLAGAGPRDAPGGLRLHHAPRADRVLFIFLSGGPSHLETFDAKPDLQRLHGEKLPASFGMVKTRRGVDKNRLLATKRTFRRHGECGMEVSDLLPRIAEHVDDICLLRGCHGDSVTHPESVYLMNTGTTRMGKPSLGAWVEYGLGSASRNLPGYVVLPDPKGWVKGGAPAWGSGFLPAEHQGTVLRGGRDAILYLDSPHGATRASERRALDFIQQLNREHLYGREEDSRLSARIDAYELAYRMQAHAPEAVDIERETPATKALYGLDRKETAEFGARCLLARRLLERGVRFVQVYSGDTNGWDAHDDIEENHARLAAESDGPVAALLQDLKARGMLERTLVVWGGEFGRTPMTEGTKGRDHNPHGFCMWLAGGGVKGGQVLGATDPIGLRAAEETTHVHDVHATILHLLGFDHERLTYRHNGRDERLTDVAGVVIRKALA